MRQPQNTLQPTGLSDSLRKAPFLSISRHEATLQTGQDTLVLTSDEAHRWYIEKGYEQYATLTQTAGKTIVIPTNNTDENADFCVIAATSDGREAACHLVVKPSQLPPPTFTRSPQIKQKGQQLHLDYMLKLEGRRDESRITWFRNGIPVSTSNGIPKRTYQLTEADQGQQITATIAPKHQRCSYGEEVSASMKVKTRTLPLTSLSTDFHDFPCQWQDKVLPGYWTVDGYKPNDTKEYPWAFDHNKPMWEYGEGFNGAVGMGLLQAQRGARLMYTPLVRKYGDMSLVVKVDPTKTAGQGFGSATGQYMDVCLKFDTKTLTGYGLRIIRTTKHAKAVDFLLVRYDHGIISPVSEAVSSTCYRTNCTISIDFIGDMLSAHVETETPQPADSKLPRVVDLKAQVVPNEWGGIHIQHTGSCGESTTMLHHLQAKWK